MQKSRLTVIVAAVATGGCTSPPPTYQEIAAADFGSYPALYQGAIDSYLRSTLRDPGSAIISMPRAPVRTYAGVRVRTYGWGTCMSVNAKNGYGGYTGQNLYFFLFREGKIVVTERAGVGSSNFEVQYVNDLCKRLI